MLQIEAENHIGAGGLLLQRSFCININMISQFNIIFEQLLLEAKKGVRCTKVTGQQSSTRDDKKYMRCARVGGKLKRIHYGDPNLRIKKSNPKKRKSFRARHKCSSAKPGTARYFSCKNWNLVSLLVPAAILMSNLCSFHLA